MEFLDYDTRVAAYCLILDDQDRVLLALWNEADQPTWTMPGGGVEFDETLEQAAVRELKEETGYDVELGPILGVSSYQITPAQRHHDTDRPMKAVRVVFAATVVGGELTQEVDGTTDEARWIPLSEVASLHRVGLVDIALSMGGVERG